VTTIADFSRSGSGIDVSESAGVRVDKKSPTRTIRVGLPCPLRLRRGAAFEDVI
jgi:hypothetical protein